MSGKTRLLVGAAVANDGCRDPFQVTGKPHGSHWAIVSIQCSRQLAILRRPNSQFAAPAPRGEVPAIRSERQKTCQAAKVVERSDACSRNRSPRFESVVRTERSHQRTVAADGDAADGDAADRNAADGDAVLRFGE